MNKWLGVVTILMVVGLLIQTSPVQAQEVSVTSLVADAVDSCAPNLDNQESIAKRFRVRTDFQFCQKIEGGVWDNCKCTFPTTCFVDAEDASGRAGRDGVPEEYLAPYCEMLREKLYMQSYWKKTRLLKERVQRLKKLREQAKDSPGRVNSRLIEEGLALVEIRFLLEGDLETVVLTASGVVDKIPDDLIGMKLSSYRLYY